MDYHITIDDLCLYSEEIYNFFIWCVMRGIMVDTTYDFENGRRVLIFSCHINKQQRLCINYNYVDVKCSVDRYKTYLKETFKQ